MSRKEIENLPLGHLDTQLGESLSALLDGEVDELSLKRILSHQDRESINNAWSSLVCQQQAKDSSLVHDDFADVNLLSGVLAGIDNESSVMDVDDEPSQTIEAQTKTASETESSPWFKPLVNFAVAASVAVVTVIAVGQMTAVNEPIQPQGLMASQTDIVEQSLVSAKPQIVEVQQPEPAINAGRVIPVSSQALQGMVLPASAELRFNSYSSQDNVYSERNIQQLLDRHRQSSNH